MLLAVAPESQTPAIPGSVIIAVVVGIVLYMIRLYKSNSVPKISKKEILPLTQCASCGKKLTSKGRFCVHCGTENIIRSTRTSGDTDSSGTPANDSETVESGGLLQIPNSYLLCYFLQLLSVVIYCMFPIVKLEWTSLQGWDPDVESIRIFSDDTSSEALLFLIVLFLAIFVFAFIIGLKDKRKLKFSIALTLILVILHWLIFTSIYTGIVDTNRYWAVSSSPAWGFWITVVLLILCYICAKRAEKHGYE